LLVKKVTNEVKMEEKELIKKYLESINFSTNEAYINLINKYVNFKGKYLNELNKAREPTKTTIEVKK